MKIVVSFLEPIQPKLCVLLDRIEVRIRVAHKFDEASVAVGPWGDTALSFSGTRDLRSLQLDVRFLADVEPRGIKQLSTHAQGENPTAGRHGVRSELNTVQRPAYTHLLEAAEGDRHLFGDVDDGESRSAFRPEIPDRSSEP